ncbi:MAG: murein biosynthesis integral membrane protein MurJ [Syntrophomonadaceae bacterium]|nr:murein biosynthesis integral membrane protein MurJ [Syntrophomonadaceae bacterium]
MRKSSEYIYNTTALVAGTAISKLLGFIREMSIAAVFGVSLVTDAYLIAVTIPNLFFQVGGVAVTTSMIPVLTEYREKDGLESEIKIVNLLTSALIILLLIVTIIAEVFAEKIVGLVAPQFSEQAIPLAIYLFRIMFPMSIFMVMAGIATGILQSHKRFIYPAFSSIPYNLIILGSIFILGKIMGITGLAIGTLLGIICQWLFQVLDIKKLGIHFSFNLNRHNAALKKILTSVPLVLVSLGAIQINTMVDRIMASGLIEGSITALNFANRLNMLVVGIFAMAIASVIYPGLAESVITKDIERFRRGILYSINLLFIICLPLAVGIIILGEPLVRILFEHGAFDAQATKLTTCALTFYVVGLPAIALREVVLRAFYSLQDTMTPMLNGIGTVVLNIVFNFILIRYLAHGGLALATSISIIIGLFMLLWSLRRQVGSLGGALLTGCKVMIATLAMGITVYYLFNYIMVGKFTGIGILGDVVILGVCGVIGVSLYFILIKLLRVEELEWLISILRLKQK